MFVADPRVNFTGGDYFAPKAHLVILNAQRLVLGATQLAINGYGRSLSSEQFNANFVGDDSRQRTSARQVGGAAQLSGTLHLGGRELRLLGGVDGGYQHTTVRIFTVRGAAADSLSESVRTNEVDLGAFAGASLRSAAASPEPPPPVTTGSGCRSKTCWTALKAACTTSGA